MPHTQPQASDNSVPDEVLTLSEAAAYLRVPEKAVLALVEEGELPGRQIGGEFRFLKQALQDWLQIGPDLRREFWQFAFRWMLDSPFSEQMLQKIEQRVLDKLAAEQRLSLKPGSKRAILRHSGVFKDDADLEEQLARIRAAREATRE